MGQSYEIKEDQNLYVVDGVRGFEIPGNWPEVNPQIHVHVPAERNSSVFCEGILFNVQMFISSYLQGALDLTSSSEVHLRHCQRCPPALQDEGLWPELQEIWKGEINVVVPGQPTGKCFFFVTPDFDSDI